RAPENTLLSHDLFESVYARAALVSDLELLDDYPARYDTFAKRQHRWTRGDWQIARWLLPHVPDANRRRVRNTLPLIARWKIADNLRRSLAAPALVVWLLFAWALLPGSPLVWTLFVVLTLAFPVYAHLTTNVFHHPRGIPWSSHFWSVMGDVRMNTKQTLLTVVFLAHLAYLMCDAVARTFYRKLVSKKRLLEWMTAAQAERGGAQTPSAMFRFMWPAVAIAVVGAALVAVFRPAALLVAAPFLLAWALSPLVAHWVSKRLTSERAALDAADAREARLVARRTWRFFEQFVGQADNWLPPDNYQEDPERVARRTSPTNVGLLLLSTVAARDLGYAATLELVERLELTVGTLDKLQKFRGHLFNWYDTETLAPLAPQYVSTVDSGNLAGHLLALKQSCVELPDRALFGPETLAGLEDTVALLKHEAARLGAVRQRTESVTIRHLRDEIAACEKLVAGGVPSGVAAWAALFKALQKRAAEADDIAEALSIEHGSDAFVDVRFWTNALSRQARECARDLQTFAPWGATLAAYVEPIIELSSPESAATWGETVAMLDRVTSVARLSETCDAALTQLAALGAEFEPEGDAEGQSPTAGGGARPRGEREAARARIAALVASVEDAAGAANGLLARASRLARKSAELFEAMDFTFLLDPERKVFHIGYNVSAARADNSYYDLLASESRLASFVAIAKGDVAQEHWFRLGRQLTPVDGSRALISWTATMFEYLMPLLVMRGYGETLLDQTHKAAVARQIEYGDEHGVPWGISESAYNA
ncbi:MAG TPA: hypothetical protein VE360_16675, partial [Pyrinomonadaceae bacterium]|nr:hypothetical protein [Pyrinomonadaceae bacterium]